MSGIEDLLERLDRLDVRTSLDGDRLTVSAPKGALSAELREELGRRRDELKAHLKSKGTTADPRHGCGTGPSRIAQGRHRISS